ALPLSFAKVPSALVTVYLYALMLCSWAQCLGDRSIKGAMVSVSCGLIVAAATSLPLVSGLVPPSMFTAAFALLPFAFSALALVLNQEGDRSASKAKRQDEAPSPQAQPSFGVKGRTLPIIPIYATLMGFATTQFYTLNASSSSSTASLAMFLATGTVFLFVALFMVRVLDIGWCLFLSGVIFCVAIALWLFLPQPGELVVVVTGSLHWSSFLLLTAASFTTTNRQRQRCASNACLSLALFYLATDLGSLTTLLGVESRVIVGGAAAAVLLGALVFARRQEELSLAAAMAVHDKTDRGDALAHLADDYELSPREKDVFVLLADGNSLKHIADELFISENTVKRHRSNVYLKLMVNSRQELIDKAKAELKNPRA
ncbi:MAG: helix-turn-helix transcriptional regulator, partial [Gordonibacter sp.]|uniref:helix-turn-helix transcriptional regulator n=3 Tax=Gordonibacter sp. TaxID=1968902 RepID=UPI002FC7537E